MSVLHYRSVEREDPVAFNAVVEPANERKLMRVDRAAQPVAVDRQDLISMHDDEVNSHRTQLLEQRSTLRRVVPSILQLENMRRNEARQPVDSGQVVLRG